MGDPTAKVVWEKVTPEWWSSPIGYISLENDLWTGYVYRNTRIGSSWTEHKKGFRTVARAMHWVEDEAEN